MRHRSGSQRRVQTSVIVKDGPVYRYQLDYDHGMYFGTLPVVERPGQWIYLRGMKWDY